LLYWASDGGSLSTSGCVNAGQAMSGSPEVQ
jgi:hypothetical protein